MIVIRPRIRSVLAIMKIVNLMKKVGGHYVFNSLYSLLRGRNFCFILSFYWSARALGHGVDNNSIGG